MGTFLLLQHGGLLAYDDVLTDQLPPPVREGRWDEALGGALPLVTCGAEAPLRAVLVQLVEQRKHRWVGWMAGARRTAASAAAR